MLRADSESFICGGEVSRSNCVQYSASLFIMDSLKVSLFLIFQEGMGGSILNPSTPVHCYKALLKKNIQLKILLKCVNSETKSMHSEKNSKCVDIIGIGSILKRFMVKSKYFYLTVLDTIMYYHNIVKLNVIYFFLNKFKNL